MLALGNFKSNTDIKSNFKFALTVWIQCIEENGGKKTRANSMEFKGRYLNEAY